MDFTGERFIPGVTGEIEAEHFHRYLIALKVAHGREVLDIACGEGYGSNLLAEIAHKVTGVDISDEAITHARNTYQKPNLSFQEGTCIEIPLNDNSVDMVVSFETIEHHDQHEAMLREFQRVLRPGGLVLISSPNRPEFDRLLTEPHKFHVKELDFNEFSNLLNAHFANTTYYAQRVLCGSLLVPYQRKEIGFTSFTGIDATKESSELDRPIFFLALASDAHLPTLATSLYECQELAPSTKANNVFLEMRLYLSEYENGCALQYTEARSISEIYRVDGALKSARLYFPSDLQSLAHLRLDVANAPAAIEIHSIILFDGGGNVIWQWLNDCEKLVSRNGVVLWSSDNDTDPIALCLNGDPQFELDLPKEILSLARGGASVLIKFNPKPLLESLPAIFEKTLNANILKANNPLLNDPVGHLTIQLEELASLLKVYVNHRDMEIAEQRATLDTMRNTQGHIYDELRRAEAQLDLLKDVLLGDQDNDRL